MILPGCPLLQLRRVSKILWIKENNPELFERTATFATTQCIHLRQLGVENAPTDMADGGYTGLMDVNALDWSAELLDALGIPLEKMPRLVDSGVLIGEVSRQAAQETGLAPGTPLVTAGGDLQVAGAGLGIVKKGTISVGIGSGGGILIYLDEPLRHPDMGLTASPMWCREAGKWKASAWHRAPASSGTGMCSGKWKKTWPVRMEWMLMICYPRVPARSPPGANGLLFMPALAGSGAPCWLPHMRGALLGVTLATSKNDINRAVMEGICLEIRAMIEAVRQWVWK